MPAYQTPLVRAVSLEAASLACNAQQRNTSGSCSRSILQCVTIDTAPVFVAIDPENPPTAPAIDTSPILTNTLLGVSDGGIRVQPFANTGVPGSQPVTVGAPIGIHGIRLELTATRGSYEIDPNGLGVSVLDSHFALANLILP